MAETFGKQGGMEGIVSAGNNMQQASKTFRNSSAVFKTSVGKWSFGVFMLKDTLGKFTKDIDSTFVKNRKTFLSDIKDMGGIITKALSAFTKAKWIDTVADMVDSIYSVRKSLESMYGAFGSAGDEFTSGIMQQSKITNEFGARWLENMASFDAIATKLGSLNFDMNMVGNNTILAKAMDMSEEMAANITTAFKFAGATTKSTMDFMEDVNKGATKMGLSPALVAQNIAASEKSMMRFAVNTEKGRSKLQQMALISSKMGTDIDNMVSAMDQFRTVGGAMEGSARLSLLGMNTNAMQLLSNARSSDPTKFFEESMKHLEKFADSKTGQLNPIGYDIANALGPMLNMSFDEIQKALYRLKDPKEKDAMMKHYKTMKERAIFMQNMTEKISNSLYGILMFLSPAIDLLTKTVDKLTSNSTLLKAIIVGITALHFTFKLFGAQILKHLVLNMISGPGKIGSSSNRRMVRNWAIDRGILTGVSKQDEFGRFLPQSDGVSTGRFSRRARVPRGNINTINAMDKLNRSNTAMLNAETSKITAQSVRMLAAVPAILAFGGSMIMLAKAFKMFGEVDWSSAKYGGIVMGGLVAAMFALSKAKVGWEAAAMLGALGAAALLSATAFKILSSAISPLMGRGSDIAGLAGGLVALSGAMSLVSLNALSSIVGGTSLWMASKSIEKIGEVALKYSSPINQLANGIGNLSNSLYRLQSLSIEPIKLDGIKQLGDIAEKYPKLLSQSSGQSLASKMNDVIQVHLHSTIELDGLKLGEATAGTLVSLNSGRGIK